MSDILKDLVAQNPEHIQPIERVICGGLAGGTAQVSRQSIPFLLSGIAT